MGAFAVLSRPIYQKANPKRMANMKNTKNYVSTRQNYRRFFYLPSVIALAGMASLFLCQPSAQMQGDDGNLKDTIATTPQTATPTATFTVTNTNDSGAGSLRQAILNANANPNSGGPDVINFAIPGGGVKTISPSSALPNISDPVIIDGTTQGSSSTPLIELNGANAGPNIYGFNITGGGSTIRDICINRWSRSGIYIRNLGGNTVQGNLVGTDPSGTIARPNGDFAVFVDGSSNNLIGGTTVAARNICSASTSFSGIAVGGSTATGNTIQGNFVGTDITGTLALPNGGDGVYIGTTGGVSGSPHDNLVGGTVPGAGNLLSGNASSGFEIFAAGSGGTGNVVQGNLIGTDVTGTNRLANTDDGVLIGQGSNNTIGGTTVAARNIISGNGGSGVDIVVYSTGAVASNNLIQGNFIGTNASGTAALGNTNGGVIIDASRDNTIGGSSAGAGNLISGNNISGIFIQGGNSANNVIQGNLIGTKANGIDPLGNGRDGMYFSSVSPASNNTVGGTISGQSNVVAFNGRIGVFVNGGTNNAISGNSIFGNTGLGIDLGVAGVTPNDPGDGDSGANNLQNFPVLTSASSGGGNTTIQGNLNSTASTAFRVEFFSNTSCDPSGNGEGQTFVGFTSVTTVGNDAAINVAAPVAVTPGQFITSTATDLNGNTSEFSACVQVTASGPAVVGGRVFTSDGRGLRNATVSITGPNGYFRQATTSSFGFYSFTDVAAGQTYTIRVFSRFFRFQPRTLLVTGDLSNVDFNGLE